MDLPTASEITRLFLYGTTIVPNLVDAALIRPDISPTKIPSSRRLQAPIQAFLPGPIGAKVMACHCGYAKKSTTTGG
jgi:hypothetical protein